MGVKDQGAVTNGRWVTIPRTLCFIYNGDDVLLMKRSIHRRVFPGRYNGVGGHIEQYEDPYTGALREIEEETGLTPERLKLCAVYNIDTKSDAGVMLFVFTAWSTNREVRADSNEGTLHWVARSEVLSLELADDLPVILPKIFEMSEHDSPLFVHMHYDKDDQLVMRFA